MNRTMQRYFTLVAMTLATTCCFLAPESAHSANLATWESANSLVDTTNYTGLAPYYWFANAQNPNSLSPVTGAPMDQNEARNLPSWVHLESRPACIGKADDCVTNDTASRTGFSFVESGGVGDTTIGGQANFNTLTLPNGSVVKSGQAVEQLVPGGSGTSNELFIRILSGAPSSFRMWVVTDSGSGANYQVQSRMRVSLRDTNGPPDYTGDIGTSEAEALPNGQRLDNAVNPQAHNGTADAWAFLLSDVNLNDLVIVRPTSPTGSFPAFAGLMIQEVIPEPTSVVLLALGALGFGGFARRRRG